VTTAPIVRSLTLAAPAYRAKLAARVPPRGLELFERQGEAALVRKLGRFVDEPNLSTQLYPRRYIYRTAPAKCGKCGSSDVLEHSDRFWAGGVGWLIIIR
jgi:hypothetical protein